jgi:hypothetical protein
MTHMDRCHINGWIDSIAINIAMDSSQATLSPDDSLSQFRLYSADSDIVRIDDDSDAELTPSTQDPHAKPAPHIPAVCLTPVPKQFVIVTSTDESLFQAYETLHKVEFLPLRC